MAVFLEVTYGKKIGLREYSSHHYSISIRTELTDLTRLEEESARIYRLLQASVDREIRETGFLPDVQERSGKRSNSQASGDGCSKTPLPKKWHCSPKQQELILRLCETNGVQESDLQELSRRLFGAVVADLDKLQASALITEMIKQFSLRIAKARRQTAPGTGAPNA